MTQRRHFIKLPLALALAGTTLASRAQSTQTLLNVSYDPTREMYVEFNAAFARDWNARTGQAVRVDQSHGGSGRQARSIIDGLAADVATLALAADIDALHVNGAWVPENWQQRLPHNSSPYTSTMILVVRRGNPKGIKDWDDLVRPGVSVIMPNPKTSGGARWNYLAAWEFARRRFGGQAQARDFVTRLYRNVLVLDTGARGSSVTFARRNQGDVLVSWENEAHLLKRELGAEPFELVYPSLSILAEPPVTVVDRNVDRRGTRAVATAYLEYLYSQVGQDIVGKHFFRPRSETAFAKHSKQFPRLNLFTIEQAFGGWGPAMREHFATGAVFDQIFDRR
ncbi:sulfate ABC transporter substrate-binding protein [Hydrogenophaga sp.]|uniref:sulfate ABC transporter substrate-binding protein n=1 Tax=Hydrogenophaga sp. TaxID=1904254 RepID=UPI0019C6CA4D|nr:sulfate ABC transporter substrate-binding protein [Hydrogenophaga sp.]MBD3893337.1 sulfate ABC transporter substrate-binding protein [Hydrogenophaga sp.]